MIAKIVTGVDFAGVVNYILDKKKGAELLSGVDLRLKNTLSIIKSFVAQTELNLRVTKPVGHISLDFSIQDKDKLSNELMLKVANVYMTRMGIVNTQFVIVRHYDREHPHIHIVFNRIANSGKMITNKNDRYRSEKICKELTRKYDLYLAKGKENVKVHRLKEPDKTKYEIYNCLKENVPVSRNWAELELKLRNDGIEIKFKFRGKTDVVQGISFTKNNLKFNGSKVDRQFSFSKIDNHLKQNLKKFLDQNQLDRQAISDYNKIARLGANFFKPEYTESKEKDSPKLKPQKKKRRGYRM